MDIAFEGRPLDLGDVLLLQTDDRSDRVKARIVAFEMVTDGDVVEDAWYTLRECQRTMFKHIEHRLSLVDLKARCIRDPEDRERRKWERRKG